MKIDVYRLVETSRSILGRMEIDGKQFCYSLEPSRLTPVHPGHPCVPIGTYSIALSMSPHFHYTTPEILDVPGRTAIRIHRGNKPEDSLGCTLVGDEHGPDWISNSSDAFDRLMRACLEARQQGEIIFIEYHDLEPGS
jgi:hypothetical protein